MINTIFKVLLTYFLITAGSTEASSKLPIPRFVSIKSNEANARAGPSIKSQAQWIFVKRGEPVEIIAEYQQWRNVRDVNGEGGWVHSSVLSGKQYVVIVADQIIPLIHSLSNSKIIAKVAPQLRCQLNKCQEQLCNVTCKNYQGWIQKKYLWGI